MEGKMQFHSYLYIVGTGSVSLLDLILSTLLKKAIQDVCVVTLFVLS